MHNGQSLSFFPMVGLSKLRSTCRWHERGHDAVARPRAVACPRDYLGQDSCVLLGGDNLRNRVEDWTRRNGRPPGRRLPAQPGPDVRARRNGCAMEKRPVLALLGDVRARRDGCVMEARLRSAAARRGSGLGRFGGGSGGGCS